MARAFQAGEKVQLSDKKAKKVTIQLASGQVSETGHGLIRHDDIIGQMPGTIVTSVSKVRRAGEESRKNAKAIGGWEYLCLRPRLMDYQLSMPRGAQIMYPKDIALTLMYGDIRSGMRVMESGGGSGAMSLALIDAVGEAGHVTTIEKRPEFAEISAANVELYFGKTPSQWNIEVGGFDEVAASLDEHSYDRLVFDLLDPWNHTSQAWRILQPGAVMTCYVTTTTQMSRLCEQLRAEDRWTEPEIYELMERTWKAEGLAVRPNHDMIGHTGFLVIARTMAAGVEPLKKNRHGSKDVYSDVDRTGQCAREALADAAGGAEEVGAAGASAPASGASHSQAALDAQDVFDLLESLDARTISDHKIRRVLRDLHAQVTLLRSLTSDGEQSAEPHNKLSRPAAGSEPADELSHPAAGSEPADELSHHAAESEPTNEPSHEEEE